MFRSIRRWVSQLSAPRAGGARPRRRGLGVELLESRVQPNAATINWAEVGQSITGIGGSSAWMAADMPAAQQALLFSQTQGIGLSLLRIRIAPDGTVAAGELHLAQAVQAQGVKVWATPWTPPAAWKSNGRTDNSDGGYLLPARYQDYANQLATFWLNMNAQGVPVYAISLQNEPDVWVGYEGCTWSADQFAAFLPVVARTFAARGVAAKLILPEAGHWTFGLAERVLNDPALRPYVGVLAAHGYGTQGPTYAPPATGAYTPVPHGDAQLWQTEVAKLNNALDTGIADGLFWANNVRDAFAVGGVNAWHYWWLRSNNPTNEGLLGVNGEVTKRLYTVGNYSKFVRPGWVYIGETDDGGVRLSAFRDPAGGQFAVVVVNPGGQVTEQFNLAGFRASAVTPWVTSAAASLAQQSAVPTVNGGAAFSATLAAQSVTTFVGQALAASGVPGIPGPVTVTTGDGQLALGWAAATGAASYTLYRGTSPGGEGAAPYRTGVTGTTFTDTGLTNGATYYYQVSAVNGSGEGGRTAEAAGTPRPAGNLLQNPGFETGSPAPWGTNWATVTTGGAHGGAYAVIVSGTSSGGIWYDVTGLRPSTTYTLSAFARNSAGATTYLFAKGFGGPEVDAPVAGAAYAPVAVTFRTGPSGTTAQIGLWKLNGTATVDDFNLSVAPPAITGVSPASGPVGGGTTVTITGTGFGGTTTVRFGATAAAVFRVLSDTQITATAPAGVAGGVHVTVVTPAGVSVVAAADQFTYVAAPPPPTNVTATPGDRVVTLAWSALTGATSYNVYRGTSRGGEGATAYRTGVTGTTFIDTGLTNGVTYYYQLSAVNAGGESVRSAEVAVAPCAGGPRNLLTNPGFESGSLAGWGSTQSTVTTSNPHGGAYAVSVTGAAPYGSGIWQDVTGLTPNTTYTFRVYVRTSAGATAYLFAKGFGGQEVNVVATGTEYNLVTLTFTTGSTNTTAQIGLWVGSGTTAVLADDFFLGADG